MSALRRNCWVWEPALHGGREATVRSHQDTLPTFDSLIYLLQMRLHKTDQQVCLAHCARKRSTNRAQ
jgi:hypothetical protein